MKLIKLTSYIFAVVLLIIAFAISSENGQDVELNLLFVKFSVPLAFALYAAFIAGIIVTVISSLLKKLLTKSHA